MVLNDKKYKYNMYIYMNICVQNNSVVYAKYMRRLIKIRGSNVKRKTYQVALCLSSTL